MKHLLTSTLIASAFALCAAPAFAGNTSCPSLTAQDTVTNTDTLTQAALVAAVPLTVQDTVVEDETTTEELLLAQTDVVYTDIDVSEVPEAVAAAVSEDYEGYVVEQAAKGTDNSYRLLIKNGDRRLMVYYNEDGEFLKEEALDLETLVVLG